jgi:hypothetical protein
MGMGMTSQGTDFETSAGEMPGMVWANSDAALADKIGIHVEFIGGVVGTAVYSGVAGLWNTNGFSKAADSVTGFFASAGDLHYLYNSAATFAFPKALPMAWLSLVMPWSNNFDLDYNEQGNSNFRASLAGWEEGTVTLYSASAAAPMLLAGLGGLLALRRRRT